MITVANVYWIATILFPLYGNISWVILYLLNSKFSITFEWLGDFLRIEYNPSYIVLSIKKKHWSTETLLQQYETSYFVTRLLFYSCVTLKPFCYS